MDIPDCDSSMSSDPIFEQEQAHLSRTYSELLQMRAEADSKLQKIDEDAAADKDAMAEELTLNATSFDEAFETYASFATANSVIDSYNIAAETTARKLKDIDILLRQPYFAKIKLSYPSESGGESRELYIGAAGISDDDYKRMVVDWRSPVAEVYYNQEMGHTSYKANGRTIEVDLDLRRQFDISRDKLNAYFDTNIAIEDPLLLASLSEQRTQHMKAITTTIQKEQNTVIRHDDVPALLVSGVAGSGKTSVLLQRIAYLFYSHREDLRPDQVFLVTPNGVFREYIQNVLPDMGESNPCAMTFAELAQSLLPEGMGVGAGEVNPSCLRELEAGISKLSLSHGDYNAIADGKIKFITPNQVDGLMHKYSRIPMGPRRITLVREELLKRFEQRLKRMAANDRAEDDLDALSLEDQLRIFHETISPQSEDEVKRLAFRMYADKFSHIRRAIENDDWLRIDRIGMGMLGSSGLSPMEWLYLKIALTGMSRPDVRYVMIDEVQDYTPAQLMVMAAYFRRAHFMLLGDENQAIGDNATSFADVARVFEHAVGSIDRCDLMISYRSTPQITELFASLAQENEGMRIESVHPTGDDPEIIECEDEAVYKRELMRVIENARSRDGLTAIIVPWKSQLKALSEYMGQEVEIVDDASSLPEKGVFLTTLKLAKGLEFDGVVIPDANEVAFKDTDASKRRLYTAISRATRYLTVLSNGRLTGLLSER